MIFSKLEKFATLTSGVRGCLLFKSTFSRFVKRTLGGFSVFNIIRKTYARQAPPVGVQKKNGTNQNLSDKAMSNYLSVSENNRFCSMDWTP